VRDGEKEERECEKEKESKEMGGKENKNTLHKILPTPVKISV